MDLMRPPVKGGSGHGASDSVTWRERTSEAITAPVRMNTPPTAVATWSGSPRNATVNTVAQNGSDAEMTEARTGPRRRSPANRPKNAPAVSADEPSVDPHCSQPEGHCQTPAITDTT